MTCLTIRVALFLDWLEDARQREVAEPHAMTLSTVDSEGVPDARVLVLKDVGANGWAFASTRTSAKAIQLEASSQNTDAAKCGLQITWASKKSWQRRSPRSTRRAPSCPSSGLASIPRSFPPPEQASEAAMTWCGLGTRQTMRRSWPRSILATRPTSPPTSTAGGVRPRSSGVIRSGTVGSSAGGPIRSTAGCPDPQGLGRALGTAARAEQAPELEAPPA